MVQTLWINVNALWNICCACVFSLFYMQHVVVWGQLACTVVPAGLEHGTVPEYEEPADKQVSGSYQYFLKVFGEGKYWIILLSVWAH